MNQNRFPIYIVSKGRHDSRLTNKALFGMGVPHYIVVEEQEYDAYKAAVQGAEILVLDKKFQDEYDTFDDLGSTKSKGPGPARNFAWDHAIRNGHKWHWVMDDNIRDFWRLNNNLRVRVQTGAIITAMEDFVLRYTNVVMAGPNYYMFIPNKAKTVPFIANTRIYSCNFIRNDIPYRWRGRYNEDTDISLRILKDGLCTLQFNAFLQEKVTTQHIKGGNTAEFYSHEGTMPKSRMQVKMHPDISRLVWKFGRWRHHVDYSSFRANALIKRPDLDIPQGINDYGMIIKKVK